MRRRILRCPWKRCFVQTITPGVCNTDKPRSYLLNGITSSTNEVRMLSLTTPETRHQLLDLAKGSRANSSFATNNPNVTRTEPRQKAEICLSLQSPSLPAPPPQKTETHRSPKFHLTGGLSKHISRTPKSAPFPSKQTVPLNPTTQRRQLQNEQN